MKKRLIYLVVALVGLGLAALVANQSTHTGLPSSGAERSPSPLDVLNLDHVEVQPAVEADRVAACIAKRYRISPDAARKLVQLAGEAGARHKLSGNMILAIAAIESNFHPLVVSPVGALGLMQVLPSAHRQRLAAYGDERNWLKPEVNLMVGAEILATFIRQTRSLDGGLAAYVGAGSNLDHPYVSKVKYELELYNDCAKGVPRNLKAAAPAPMGRAGEEEGAGEAADDPATPM